ncbi:MAG TPA: hypothetical protein VGG03_11590 [Thermoanaerobaculia bacterium]|jgi:hypothetical protein
MQISSKILRAALMAFALTLSVLALGYPVGAAECNPGDERWVPTGECCSIYGKYLKQVCCAAGTWENTTTTSCFSHCAM